MEDTSSTPPVLHPEHPIHHQPSLKASPMGGGLVLWIVLLVGVLALNGYLFLIQTQTAAAKATAKAALEQDLATLQSPEARAAIAEGKALDAQINGYVAALNNRYLWSKLLAHLQASTYISARYNSVSVSDDGTVRIDGETDSFSSVAKAYVALRDYAVDGQPAFEEVTLGSVAVTPPGKEGESSKASFSVTLKLKLDLVRDPKAPETSPRPSLTPTVGTTPSS